MSLFLHPSWTFALPDIDFPVDLAPADFPRTIYDGMGHPETLLTQVDDDWLHRYLSAMVRTLGGTALSFLVTDPEAISNIGAVGFQSISGSDMQFEERWLASPLHHARTGGAVAELDSWFQVADSNPERLAPALDCGDPEEISLQLREAQDSIQPQGEGLFYLFSFLKRLRSILVIDLASMYLNFQDAPSCSEDGCHGHEIAVAPSAP